MARARAGAAPALVFTVAGAPGTLADRAPRGPATDRSLIAEHIAALPDGGFVTASETAEHPLLRVGPRGYVGPLAHHGRLPQFPYAIAAASDGSVLVASDDGVDRVTPDGEVSRVISPESSTFDVAAAPDGSILLSDNVSGKDIVRRVEPDGRARTVAGNGTQTQDGGLATDATFGDGLEQVAGFADGSFLVALDTSFSNAPETLVRRVATDGRIFTVAGGGARSLRDRCIRGPVPARSIGLGPVNDLVARPDGSFIVASEETGLHVVTADGMFTTLACGSVNAFRGSGDIDAAEHESAAFLRRDGQPASQAVLDASGAAVATDGTLLIANSDRVVMLAAPGQSTRLAVALRPRKIRPGIPGVAAVTLTRPAEISVRVTGGRRTLGTLRRALPAGATRLRLPPMRSGRNTIEVAARASGAVATARSTVLAGALPINLARRIMERRTLDFAEGTKATFGRCSRSTPTRVTCAPRAGDPDGSRDTARLRTDGLIEVTVDYRGSDDFTYLAEP